MRQQFAGLWLHKIPVLSKLVYSKHNLIKSHLSQLHMETLFIPTENEIKRWLKEAMKEYVAEYLRKTKQATNKKTGY